MSAMVRDAVRRFDDKWTRGKIETMEALLQFENAATRFAKIGKTIEELLADNPKLTTLDINRILYRQFGTRIHKGTVSWSGETIRLSPEVTEQLRQNYLVSRGLHPSSHTAINRNSLPQSIVHSCTT